MDAGLNYPIPTFSQYLFSQLPKSSQGGAQVPARLDQLTHPRGDVRDRSRESWTWLVAVLQFWGDEASIANGIVYGGCERPISALAEYVLNTVNPGFEPGCQITWDDVVIRMALVVKATAWDDCWAREDGLAPGPTSTRQVFRVGNCPREKIFRTCLECFARKG